MSVTSRQQMWTGGRAGAARTAADNRRPALAGSCRQGQCGSPHCLTAKVVTCRSHCAPAFSLSHARALPVVRRRPAPVALLPRWVEPVATPTFCGAIFRSRLQFIRIGQQVCQDKTNPPKTHQHVLSSAVVAVEANHDWERFSRAQIPFVSGAKSV